MSNNSAKKRKLFTLGVVTCFGIGLMLALDMLPVLRPVSFKAQEVLAVETQPIASLRVCKIVSDEQWVVSDGAAHLGVFTIQAPTATIYIDSDSTSSVPTTSFTTPLTLNTDLLGNDGINDAQCITYSNLEFSNYLYGEEQVQGSNWLEPLYSSVLQGEQITQGEFATYTDGWFTETTSDNGGQAGHNGLVDMYPYVVDDWPEQFNQTLVIWNRYQAPQPPVNQAPSITLLGFNLMQVVQGSVFIDPGATSTDLEDGDLTSQIKVSGVVNTTATGTYPLTYSVHDSGGLGATTTRNVSVYEPQPGPTATLQICKLITNEQGVATSGQWIEGNFTLEGPQRPVYIVTDSTSSVPTTVFQTPLTLNADILGNDGINDAQCLTYTHLPLSNYFFDREVIQGSNWLAPKYYVYKLGETISLNDFDVFHDDWYTPTTTDDHDNERTNGLVDMYPGEGPANQYNQAVIIWNRYQTQAPPVNQAPSITLLVSNPFNVQLNATFTDPGATSTDPEDGDLTSQIKVSGVVNTTATGTYPLTYSVHDSGGLGATTTRQVIVMASSTPTSTNEAPVITLTGQANLTLAFGASFTDPGATALDFEDGNITSQIVKSGDVVNTSNAGPYTIKYNVQDSQGLSAQEKTRIIQVQEQGGGGGGGGSGSVIVSVPSLIISNEQLQEQGQGQVVFTWETNDPADSKVVYGTSSIIDLKSWSLDYGYPVVTAVQSALTKTHSVVIFGLDKTLKYYFRPVSDNPQSNPAVGKQLIWPQEGPVIPPVVPPAVGECYYLLEYLKIGQANNPVEVRKLQTFLNLFDGANLPVDGFFDQATFNAVEKFQAEHQSDVLLPWGGIDPTGYVYITTKKKVNEMYCQRPFPLTGSQEQEVNDFKNYFEQNPEMPTSEVGYLEPILEQPVEGTQEPFTPEVSLDNEGLVANIGPQASEQEETGASEEEGLLSSLSIAGVGGLVSSQLLYWFALIFMVLVLFSVVLYFRAKRKKEIPYSVPPFPENIPVQ
ncbi:DUF5011 domain-containing protein [Candidatus Parcubacteria bacterium]|nr:DUF5011 domain-containing protein [Candidatus Parcubacteria bacterium]